MIITLCGSLSFEREINEWNEKLSLAGYTVYSMAVMPSYKEDTKDWYTEEQKEILDLVHLSKIEESDAIVVVDPEGYIGESTEREIKWAIIRDKAVYYTHEGFPKASVLIKRQVCRNSSSFLFDEEEE